MILTIVGESARQRSQRKIDTLESIEEKLNFKTLEWRGDHLRLLDQRALPEREEYRDCRTVGEVAAAIKNMTIRGAPAIGIAAAYGMALAALNQHDYREAAALLKSCRPTAANLAWAVDRMSSACALQDIAQVIAEAGAIEAEDAMMCRQIGVNGNGFVADGANVLTHCNAGALATGGIGTALGIIYTAHFSGKRLHVWVDETRPFLQGARLTAWELGRAGVPYTLICDNVAASLMAAGKVDCVIVGADRIAANGDFANKIGTYGLAVLAGFHNIPFYVAAPSSTFDSKCATGEDIVIEERDPAEVTFIFRKAICPHGCAALNPAFDVTPGSLVTAYITEKEVIGAGGFESGNPHELLP